MPKIAKTRDGVMFKRQEALDIETRYQIIEDAISGEQAVKARGATYLPIPSSCDTHSVTDPRYVAYQTRAVYYNVTQPTRDALVGQLFLRPPQVELPPELEPMLQDMNGEGLTLEQLIRKAANYVLPYGRGGFLADFPETKGEVTVSQLKSGEVRPIVRFFEPWCIRNWRVEKRGNVHKLVLLVLDESYEAFDDAAPYVVTTKIRQRVYQLKNDKCVVELYQDEDQPAKKYEVKDSNGEPLGMIPFEFVGSENNDADVDDPPFYNLANLNIAHFRNSADYEESAFLVGQPTPVYTGLTQDWMDNYFEDGISFGSRASIPLPEKATAQLLQADPNTLAFEAMVHKEDQMIAIGAKIINPKQKVERKEAEIQIEAASQRSVLTTIKDNLQLAIVASLKRAASFVGADPEAIKVTLNDNFDLTSMSAEEIRWLLELYAQNAIPFTEMRENLRRSGIAKLTDDEAKKLIMEDKTMKDALTPKIEQEQADAKNAASKAAASKTPVKKSSPSKESKAK